MKELDKSELSIEKREEARLSWQPDKTKVLFIGESPPRGGTFFYLANSCLYEYTKKAFFEVYGKDFKLGAEFLQFFKSSGCYLDDLCLQPINDLSPPDRRLKRANSVAGLAERIKKESPDVVIVVIKKIKKEAVKAINLAQVGELPTYFLPFPGQRWQNEYVKELKTVLYKLRVAGILKEKYR
jgi:hypothetical protein